MTGPEELRIVLRTLRDTIASILKPELNSAWAKGNADSVIMTLNRILGEIDSAPKIAAPRLDRWVALQSSLEELYPGELPPEVPACGCLTRQALTQKLKRFAARLQQRIDANDNGDRFCRRSIGDLCAGH